MARQDGFMKLTGTIGGVTFYKVGTEYYAKLKSSLEGERVKTSHEFKRTRENNSEFGRATRNIKQIKESVREILVKDRFYFSRLTKVAMEIVRSDAVNDRGERLIHYGEVNKLNGFAFNGDTKTDILSTPVSVNYVNSSGALNVEILPFTPSLNIVKPGGATHFKIRVVAAEHDFENEGYDSYLQETGYIDLSSNAQHAVIDFDFLLTPATQKFVMVCLAIQFYQLTNGVYYEIETGNSCDIIYAVSRQAVSNFNLVNADTDVLVSTVYNGDVIKLSLHPYHITISYVPTQVVASVKLELTGHLNHTQTENIAPYSVAGDISGNYTAFAFTAGIYNLKATTYSGQNATGNILTVESIDFEIGT